MTGRRRLWLRQSVPGCAGAAATTVLWAVSGARVRGAPDAPALQEPLRVQAETVTVMSRDVLGLLTAAWALVAVAAVVAVVVARAQQRHSAGAFDVGRQRAWLVDVGLAGLALAPLAWGLNAPATPATWEAVLPAQTWTSPVLPALVVIGVLDVGFAIPPPSPGGRAAATQRRP